MAHQFRPIIGGIYGGNIKSFIYYTRDECINIKIMEHAWWSNEFVNNISLMFYNNPKRLCWVGEYSEDKDFKFNVLDIINIPCYEDAYGENSNYEEIQEFLDFSLDNKFLVNFDTEEYIDMEIYKKKSFGKINGILHPIPLITAVGNDKGLGDFHKDNIGYENIGIWAWNLIAILDKVPKDFTKIDIIFSESKII